MSGLAIECATERAEVLVVDAGGQPRAHRIEPVGHHHTQRMTPLVRETLEAAGVDPLDLEWVAADLGPGSFTGVRVGLATARALALAAGAEMIGASSLATLALGTRVRSSLIVPLVTAGRRDVYAGWFRSDSRGKVSMLAAPRVGTIDAALDATSEVLPLLGERARVVFVGPGAARERAPIEDRYPRSTRTAWRFEGLSAIDLAAAVRSDRGAAAGLPVPGAPLMPAYVRPAQAESRVRHRALAAQEIRIRSMTIDDVPAIMEIERAVFTDAWTAPFFRGELKQGGVWARIAEWSPGAIDASTPRLAGYLMAWTGYGEGHIGNIAVVPDLRRHGIASALLDDLAAHARDTGVSVLTLEVRATNDSAQAQYQPHGVGLAGLRRGYYRDSGEDALILARRETAVTAAGRATEL
jgi:ribosomal-protein-alanine N-acetyltransferase